MSGIKLNEAIERYSSNAEFERSQGNLQGCLEFRQLAKWLRELRMYRCYLEKKIKTLEQEPKIGHWIDDEFGSKCSCCNIYTHLDKFDRPMLFRYCSMCGAKMVEIKESEE